ncbi:MAG: T9SS type A sorting domain-containing protein [Krumholzibacteria bacterium]|nr:T9SS type A sorting domain-containing protein [Candidatus Krumholzibacteria bacterium]
MASVLTAVLAASPAAAQLPTTHAVRFWVAAGGGGSSAAGSLRITGTIGQHAAGQAAAGNLVLNGGFWHGRAPALSAVDDGPPGAPVASRLHAPYPNPFNPATRIGFELAAPGPVRIRIYDARGQMVRDLVDGDFPVGRHEILWQGRNTQGGNVPSGVYFVRFEAAGTTGTEKMTLLK